MPEIVDVCRLEDIPTGQVRQFNVGQKEIVIARTGATDCYAIGGRCTHRGAPLGQGKLEGTVVTCPWHGSQFDVTTGKLLRWVQEPRWMKVLAGLMPPFLRHDTPAYQVRIADGQVSVEI